MRIKLRDKHKDRRQRILSGEIQKPGPKPKKDKPFEIPIHNNEELKNLSAPELMSDILAPLLDNLVILCQNQNLEYSRKKIIKTAHLILDTHLYILHSLDLLDS